MENQIPEHISSNPDVPASPKQTYALYMATKQDYRGKGLTRLQAYNLLQEANAKTGYVKKVESTSELKEVTRFKISEMEEHLNKSAEEFGKLFLQIIELVSLVKDDIDQTADKYIMFGFGCGFASVKIKGLHEKTQQEIFRKWRTVVETFKINFKKNLPNDLKIKLRNHITPLLAQDVQIQSFFAYSLIGYLHDQDVEATANVRDN